MGSEMCIRDSFQSGWSEAGEIGIASTLTSFSDGITTLDQTPTFEWTPLPGAASYEFWLNGPSGRIYQTDLTSPEFTPDTNLTHGNHSWWVRAVDADGNRGQWSERRTVSIGGRTEVEQPTFNAQEQVSFVWSEIDSAASYIVHVNRIDEPGLAFRQEQLTSSSYTHADALAAGTYRVWVRAINADGVATLWSDAVTFTVETAQTESDSGVLVELAVLESQARTNTEVHSSAEAEAQWVAAADADTKMETITAAQSMDERVIDQLMANDSEIYALL